MSGFAEAIAELFGGDHQGLGNGNRSKIATWMT